MTRLDLATLRSFVSLAGERLRGDWVILGGTVLPLLGGRHRITADIDVAGPDDAGQDQVVALLGIARDLGLPAETINQAGALFLREIDGWEGDLALLHRGPSATLYTPNATLFLLLKIERLTESDLDDCLAMLRLVRGRRDPLDAPRVGSAVDAALSTAPSPARAKRLRTLRTRLGGTA